MNHFAANNQRLYLWPLVFGYHPLGFSVVPVIIGMSLQIEGLHVNHNCWVPL